MTKTSDSPEARSVSPPEFPATCPKCGGQSGVPKSVSTTADGGTFVIVVCSECEERWRVDRKPLRADC